MNKNKKINVKTKYNEIKELLTDLEKDLSSFKLDIDNKDRKIKEYIKLLQLARNEYKKLVQENSLLKCQILGLRQQFHLKEKTQTKRKHIVEDRDDGNTDNSRRTITKKKNNLQKKNKDKNCKKTNKNKKTKVI